MIENKHNPSASLQKNLNASSSRTRALEMAQIIGKNLKAKRISLGLTRTDLANLVNISYQQIQKYENGINVVSAVLLYDLSLHLDIPVSNFYQGLEIRSSNDKSLLNTPNINLSTRESSEILASFSFIKSKKLRQSLIKTITLISEEEQNE